MSRSDPSIIAGRLKDFRRVIREEVARLLQERTEFRKQIVRDMKEEFSIVKEVLTHREVAHDYLSGEVTPETVIRYIREEGLPATKRGRLWFVRKEDLVAWLTDGEAS